MKYLIAALLLLASAPAFSQDDTRSTNEGTTFYYTIKEDRITYKLNAVIRRWDWDSIVFQWQSLPPKKAKGSVAMFFGAIGESNIIKIKPKAGNVRLPGDVCGWVLPYDLFDSLFNRQVTTNTTIDGKAVQLKPGKMMDEASLLYNGKKQKVLYGEGVDDAQKVRLSFVEYLNDIIILSAYSNGSFSMTLDNITGPKP